MVTDSPSKSTATPRWVRLPVDEDSDNATVDVSGFAESVADVDVTPADVTALTGHCRYVRKWIFQRRQKN